MTEASPLAGKVALVTGAGSTMGLGYAMALALAQAGAKVALLDINGDTAASSAAAIAALTGSATLAVAADVSKPEDCGHAVQQTVGALGGLHILVNNAGANPRALGYDVDRHRLWELPPEAWSRVIDINLSGAFYMLRAALPHLLAQGWGRIIGVTTSLDTMIRNENMPYGPSKAGHEALMACLAKELEGTGVTCNVLIPGGITLTGMTKYRTNQTGMLTPDVMKAPVVWLASDAPGGYTGHRVVAEYWDESAPLEQRLEAAAAPTAWPGLGRTARRQA
jgi:3-oxoacyl-[acyl-carrier protein] reductase